MPEFNARLLCRHGNVIGIVLDYLNKIETDPDLRVLVLLEGQTVGCQLHVALVPVRHEQAVLRCRLPDPRVALWLIRSVTVKLTVRRGITVDKHCMAS